jgi:hypothetical protein
MHAQWQAVAEVESHTPNAPEFIYRRVGGATKKPETHNAS